MALSYGPIHLISLCNLASTPNSSTIAYPGSVFLPCAVLGRLAGQFLLLRSRPPKSADPWA